MIWNRQICSDHGDWSTGAGRWGNQGKLVATELLQNSSLRWWKIPELDSDTGYTAERMSLVAMNYTLNDRPACFIIFPNKKKDIQNTGQSSTS